MNKPKLMLGLFWILLIILAAGIDFGLIAEKFPTYGNLPFWQKLATSHIILAVFWFIFYRFSNFFKQLIKKYLYLIG